MIIIGLLIYYNQIRSHVPISSQCSSSRVLEHIKYNYYIIIMINFSIKRRCVVLKNYIAKYWKHKLCVFLNK